MDDPQLVEDFTDQKIDQFVHRLRSMVEPRHRRQDHRSGPGQRLVTGAMAGAAVFSGMNVITTAPGEEYCANSILVNGRVLFPAGFPATIEKLRAAGLDVIEVAMSEFRKMDGGLSCLSLRMNV